MKKIIRVLLISFLLALLVFGSFAYGVYASYEVNHKPFSNYPLYNCIWHNALVNNDLLTHPLVIEKVEKECVFFVYNVSLLDYLENKNVSVQDEPKVLKDVAVTTSNVKILPKKFNNDVNLPDTPIIDEVKPLND